MNAKTLMIQGTGSGVGKSILTAAICRHFYNLGLKVAPFKAQNMALNSFVTENGDEIGRAQAFQAEASGIKPDVLMNPILLKPSGDNNSQVIVMGKPGESRNAQNYYSLHEKHKEIVLSALQSLMEQIRETLTSSEPISTMKAYFSLIDNISEWNLVMPPLKKIEDPSNHKTVIALKELTSKTDSLISSS